MRPENYQAVSHPPSHEFELNIGPNHPGIEGNYALKLKLEGDIVVAAKADAGYLHRGNGLIVVDVVTNRLARPLDDLSALLDPARPVPPAGVGWDGLGRVRQLQQVSA